MLPVLPLGPLALPTRPLLLLLGIGWGLAAVEREARRRGLPPGTSDAVGWGLLVGFVVARAAAEIPMGIASPGDLLRLLRPDLNPLALGPGLLIAALVLGLGWRRRKVPLLAGLDALSPLILIPRIAVALGDWAEGRGYGEPTAWPWLGMLGGGGRHPVQLYEAVLGLVALGLWHGGRQGPWAPGGAFLLALALAGGVGLFVEGLRADVPTWMGFRLPQVAAFALTLLSLFGLSRRALPPDQAPPGR